MWYIINLRLDALLYARTVNSIRKFFYDRAQIGFFYKQRLRTLPQNAYQPAYLEVYFLPVVLSFTFLNSSYFLLAGLLWYDGSTGLIAGKALSAVPLAGWLALVVAFALHLMLYWRMAVHRENSYLKRNAVGIDVDGVLNLHRQHFCKLLAAKKLGVLDPADITAIPVHRIPGCKVTRADELAVFNDSAYWTDMPVVPDAARHIEALRHLGLSVYIVTSRPWPLLETPAPSELEALEKDWRRKALGISKNPPFDRYLLGRLTTYFGIARPVELITRIWLAANGIRYDSLLVESGRIRLTSPRKTDRFSLARAKSVRFFVEDDLENAVKLAFICDAVFLYDQPYNSEERPSRDPAGKAPFKEQLPDNVIRVTSWDDIVQSVRRLL